MAKATYRKATKTVITGTCGKGHKGGGWSDRVNSNAVAERKLRRASKAACKAALATL